MKISNSNPSILNCARKLTDGRNPYTEVYLLEDNRVFKLLKTPFFRNNAEYNYYCHFKEHFRLKLELVDELGNHPFLILPEEVSFDKKDNIKGFSYGYSSIPDLTSFFTPDCSIESITAFYIRLTKVVKELYNCGVVAPDLINTGNILYDEKSGTIQLIDYEGLQIKNIPASAISQILRRPRNFVLSRSKYRDNNGLYTEELNTMSLLVGYLYCISGVNVANLTVFQDLIHDEYCGKISCESQKEINDIFHSLGLYDEEIINGYTNLFLPTKANPDPLLLIRKISEEYKNSKNEQQKKLIKK